jgi:endonuclease YncB( thermonuclease family)
MIVGLVTFGCEESASPGKAHVSDGDTLVLGSERIRIFGIDAPELGQSCTAKGKAWACGRWSAQVLRDMLLKGDVRCRAIDQDRYGRTVATCQVADTDLGAAVVQAGAAIAYRRYSTAYVTQEAKAKAARRGIWSGTMMQPEEFRSRIAVPQRCAIKGNISANGIHIYHMPGQENYEAVRISAAKGEAYFCTEPEARAAGFRAAKR